MANRKQVLIDLKQALVKVCESCGCNFEECKQVGCCADYTDIEQLPTVDAAPVVHGRWDNECRCTVCGWYGEDWYKRDVYYFDYCPNCGAKMDGEKCD